MKRIVITHSTEYFYKTPVEFGQHRCMVRPREGHDLHIVESRLEVEPPAEVRWLRDVYGNSIAVLTFQQPSDKLRLMSEVHVDIYDGVSLDCLIDPEAVSYPFQYNADELVELFPYRLPSYPHDGPALRKWLTELYAPGQLINTSELLLRLNSRIFESFKYTHREEPGGSTSVPDTCAGVGIVSRLRGVDDGSGPALGVRCAFCYRLHSNGGRPAWCDPCLD